MTDASGSEDVSPVESLGRTRDKDARVGYIAAYITLGVACDRRGEARYPAWLCMPETEGGSEEDDDDDST